ncbi:MAG: hypothetical protein MUF34_29780, partial [Polyangiaceae bacterium]|nr:hypothetical protein [Polyangiaceae bacterium]
VRLETPDRVVFSGADVARRTGLGWAAAVAWFTLLPLVLSRRSARAMRGVRPITVVLAAIPAIVAGSLLANPPTSAQARGVIVQLRFEWGAGLVATFALGLVAAALGAFVFGRLPHEPASETHKNHKND